jgi:hypothetical protein
MQISDKRGRVFNNKSVFLLLAIVSFSLAVYAGSYGNSGGYNPTIGIQIEEGSLEGGGSGEGGDASIDDFEHYMNMAFVINCYDGERAKAHDVGPETGRTVFSDYADYYKREGGAVIPGGSGVFPPMYPVEYEYLYTDTYTREECTVPLLGLGCKDVTYSGEVPWFEEPFVGYFEQNLSSLTDPKFARFEARGGYKCLLWTRIDHTKFKEGEYPTKDAEWWNNTAVDEYVDDVFYQVDWDRNKSQCELIGGAWKDDDSFAGYQCCGDDYIWVNNIPVNYSLSFTDEEIEERKNMDNLCLYSNTQAGSPYGNCYSREASNWEQLDTPPLIIACNEGNIQDGYVCDVPQGEPYYNLPYDKKLGLDNPDNPDEAESVVADSDDEFFFFGHPKFKVPVLETDLGKWSDHNGDNPAVCVHEFNNTEGGGDVFRWVTPEDAANLNPFYCEVILGYGWTGERCCHNLSGDITYNDEERDLALTTNAGEQFLSELGTYVSRYPSLFEHVFQKKYDQYKNLDLTKANVADNKACWESRAILHDHAIASNPDEPGTVDVLNHEGVFYGCVHSDGGLPVIDNSRPGLEQSDDQPKCTILGSHVCTYQNDSWVELLLGSLEEPTIAESKLGYVAGKNTAYPSFAPNNTDVVECCLSGTCWDGGWLDGGKCVGEDQPYQMLRNPDGTPNPSTWKPFDNQNDIDSKIIYKCDKGNWVETEPKFNWWDDTRDVKYCAQNNSCACSTDDESSYYCMHYSCEDTGYSRVNCVPKYHDEGCTNKTNYFTEDHYCEAQYAGDGNGAVISAEWTSRTKLLAAYFWKIAQLEDPDNYVIFCDYIPSSVNDLTSYADDQGLFSNPYCVLNVSGHVFVGTSISGRDMLLDESELKYDDPMKIEDEVNRFTSSGLGIIDILLGGQGHLNLYDCADAQTVDRLHGEFQRCENDNNTMYFNNKTLQIFYTREGINSVPTMTEADYINFNAFLKTQKQKALSYIQARGASSFSRSLHVDLLGYVSTYDRLYINKNGDKMVFGTMDEEFLSGHAVPEYRKNLRNVSFVIYEGLDVDCDEVMEASLDTQLTCGEHDNAAIVIETGIIATEDHGTINGLYHWNDLTSKVRLNRRD